ncbi:hypothetical protein AVEN_31660-1, partial [Araneus ventricosus]
PLSSLSAVEGMAFLNTKYNDARLDWPDVEIHLISGSAATDYTQILRQSVGMPDEKQLGEEGSQYHTGKHNRKRQPDELEDIDRQCCTVV